MGMSHHEDCTCSICKPRPAAAGGARSVVQPVVMTWVPVSERMPPTGRPVLAAYRNELGMGRRVRATWEDGATECCCEGECGARDDEGESHLIPEGWYESCDQAEEHYRIHELVTHWMPMPDGPKPLQVAEQGGRGFFGEGSGGEAEPGSEGRGTGVI